MFPASTTVTSSSWLAVGATPADSAVSNLDDYDADAGFKDVGTRVILGIGGQQWDGWKLYASASYFRMIGDAEDSPVVDDAGDADQFFGGLGVAYER